MKAPHKVKSFYQVRTYLDLDRDETGFCLSFNSYNKAKEHFEKEVNKAKYEYLVELLSIAEIQNTTDKSRTVSQYLTLGSNLY